MEHLFGRMADRPSERQNGSSEPRWNQAFGCAI